MRTPEHLKDLREPEPVPDHFAVAPAVWEAVAALPLKIHYVGEDMHRACPLCLQSMFIMARAEIGYQYTADQENGLAFAHMAQAHGWTRESVGQW